MLPGGDSGFFPGGTNREFLPSVPESFSSTFDSLDLCSYHFQNLVSHIVAKVSLNRLK